MTNWVADQNPYNLLPPPDWFLRLLWTRDRDLVLMPGIKQPVYRLARRVTKSLGMLTAVTKDVETLRMIALNVVPVTSILPTIQCWPDLLVWLDDHDQWKVGGAEGADKRLQEQEDAQRASIQRAQDDEALMRGGSGYRAMKSRLGQTVFVHSEPTRESADSR